MTYDEANKKIDDHLAEMQKVVDNFNAATTAICDEMETSGLPDHEQFALAAKLILGMELISK